MRRLVHGIALTGALACGAICACVAAPDDWPALSPQESVYLPGYGGPGQSLPRIIDVEPAVSADRIERLEAELAEQEAAADPLRIAEKRLLLASSLRRQGRWQEAGHHVTAAIEALESGAGGDTRWLVRALVTHARLQRDTGNLLQALETIERALAIATERIGDDDLLTSHVREDRGVILWRQGEHEPALADFERALATRKRLGGPGHPYTVNTSRNLAMLLEDMGRLDRLGLRYGMDLDVLYAALNREVPPLERAERIYRELAEVESIPGLDRAWALSRLAALHLDLGSYGEAAELRRGVRDALGAVALERSDAETLLRVARIHVLAGAGRHSWSETAQVAEAAAIDEYGELDPRRIDVLHGVGVLNEIAGFPDIAAQVFDRAARLRASRNDPVASRLAADLAAAGRNAWAAAILQPAEKALGRAVAILERVGPDGVRLAESLTLLSVVRAERGSFSEAGPLAERGLALARRQLAERSPVLMVWAGLLARSRRSAGTRAELLELIEAAPAFPDREVVLAAAALREGSLDEARQHLVRDLQRYEQALGLRLQRIRERRIAHSKKAMPGFITKAGQEVASLTLSRTSAVALRLLLQGDATIRVFHHFSRDEGDRSAGARTIMGGPWVNDTAPMRERSPWFFETLGAVLRADRHTDVAVAVAKWAEVSWTRKLDPSHPSLAPVLQDLAEARWDAGQDQRSIELARDSSERLDRYLHDAIAVLPEGQALNLIATRRRPETVLFSGLLASKPGNAAPWLRACWEWTVRRRALVLDELAYRHQIAAQSPEAREAWETWSRARERLASMWIRAADPGAGDPSGARLAQAASDRNQAEAALARVSLRYRELGKLRRASLEEIVRALPPYAALVEYVRVPVRQRGVLRTESRYVALVLRGKGGKFSYADLGPAARLDELVREWHERLRESFEEAPDSPRDLSRLGASGARLRAAVWDPVAKRLPGTRLVFVVMDGSLNQINLAALPSGNGYLIEDGPTFHLLSTGRDLVRLGAETASETTGAGLLALGDPDFDATDAQLAGRYEGSDDIRYRGPRSSCVAMSRVWSPLPGSGAEAHDVVSLFGGREEAVTLTGVAASEERFKDEAPGKRILHLATHGFFLSDECPSVERQARGIGGLVEARPIDESASRLGGENPLLLSGLVLAGANRAVEGAGAREDGILTAEELATLDLHGTELVALSACDTGRGTVQSGEGVFGLRRALEIAGARTVLMSLWPVPDRETRQWMRAFYGKRLGGGSVLESVRGASLDALAALRAAGRPTHPFLWAGFVAAGDWR